MLFGYREDVDEDAETKVLPGLTIQRVVLWFYMKDKVIVLVQEDGEGTRRRTRERKEARRERTDHQPLMTTIRTSSIRPFRHYCCCWLSFSTQ